MRSRSFRGDDTLCQKGIYLLHQHGHKAALLPLHRALGMDKIERLKQDHSHQEDTKEKKERKKEGKKLLKGFWFGNVSIGS